MSHMKVKVEVYSLVYSAKRHPPNFTQLLPGHRTCSFIRHLNSPRSIQPGRHYRPSELFKRTSLHCPTRYPLTPGSRERTCGQSALLRSTTRERTVIQPSWGLNPRSLGRKSRTLPLSHDASYINAWKDQRRIIYASNDHWRALIVSSMY